MVERPKRRKCKDNPYTLIIMNNKFFVEFTDIKKVLNRVDGVRIDIWTHFMRGWKILRR